MMKNSQTVVQRIELDTATVRDERVRAQSRLPRLVACHVNAEQVLERLRVGVFGAGSVGHRIALHLARLGVGLLYVVDPKPFKAESLRTHDVGPESIGQPKALLTAQQCKAVSPATEVCAMVGFGESLGWHVLADLDIILLAPDRLSAEVAIGQRCHAMGKPLIHAAVHGETLTTQIRFYANDRPDTPCPACSFGAEEWAQLDRQARFACDGSPGAQTGEDPTMSVSSLCSLAADLAVNQWLRHALQLGHPISNTLVEYCGYTNRMVTSTLRRNPSCRCDHDQHQVLCVRPPLADFSIDDLVYQAGMRADNPHTCVEIGDHQWTESGSCGCDQPVAVNRFVADDDEAIGRCPKCHAAVRALSFYQHRDIPIAKLGGITRIPLKESADPRIPWVRMHDLTRSCLLHQAQQTGISS